MISMNWIQFAHPSEWNLLFLWVNKSLALPQTSSLKVEFSPNTVGALMMTKRHDWGHASMDSVCWKCKQACICEPAMVSNIWDLVSIEHAQSLALPETLSLKSEFDPLAIELVKLWSWLKDMTGECLLKVQTSQYLRTCKVQWYMESCLFWKVSKHTW